MHLTLTLGLQEQNVCGRLWSSNTRMHKSNYNNFDSNAGVNDHSCDYDLDDDGVLDEDEVEGCTDPIANNFNPLATDDDGSCDYDLDDDGIPDVNEIDGCTNSTTANNFNQMQPMMMEVVTTISMTMEF